MKIDITQKPDADICKDRGKYLWICIVLLWSATCGALIMGYGIVVETSQDEIFQTGGMVLFIGSSLLFYYFGERLRAYKKLGLEQKQELINLGSRYLVIGTYCALIAKQARQPIFAEYEACKEWAEDAKAAQRN